MIPITLIVILLLIGGGLNTVRLIHKNRNRIWDDHDNIYFFWFVFASLIGMFACYGVIHNSAVETERLMEAAGYRNVSVEPVSDVVKFRNEQGQLCKAFVARVGDNGFAFTAGPWCDDVHTVEAP